MRIFSGIRPSGKLHIGNYLGAIKNWVNLQKENDCIFSIVDLHAITTPYSVENLTDDIIEFAAIYLSAGLDPDQCTIFIQSQIKEHAELAWLLSTITPVGELKRMTQYKTKKKNLKNSQINAGLLNYPVLMSADILLYQTEAVPIGGDQKQHLELARDLARKFNHKFGETFVIPEAIIPKSGARIMSLQNPQNKMSKTASTDSSIFLTDSPQQIKSKIKSAVTDSGTDVKYDPQNKPGISNLLTIYAVFSDKNIKQAGQQFQKTNYAQFKQKVAQAIIEHLAPFREKYKKLKNNPGQIEKILQRGQRQAQEIATPNMKKIKKRMGLPT